MPPRSSNAITPLLSPAGHPAGQGGEVSEDIPRAAIGPDGRISHANPSFCTLCDLAPDSIGGREALWVLGRAPPGTAFHFDRTHNADGRNVTIASLFAPAQETDSIARLSEISSALRRRERELSEAESIGHMGHWRWPVGGQGIVWSEEIYRIFGVKKDVFSPTLEGVGAMLYRSDAGRMIQVFQRAILEKNDYDLDVRVRRPDGSTRHIRCEGRCEKDPEGEVIALYGIMQDITEQVHHERQLRAAKESAERAYAAKSQFLANMSHELRTPLNAIIGFSEMIEKQLLGPIGTEKYLDYIKGIRESGAHLLDLISDILDMSRIEAGKYDLAPEPVHPGKLVHLAAHMMEGRAQEARIALSASVRDEALTLNADRRAVMQILLNLLSNACKFTPPGGSVLIECEGRHDIVLFRVIDTGCGIPANRIGQITRPFEQAGNTDGGYTRGHAGSGLGLAITRELVELHGGSIHIDSTVGAGTTVTVRLPARAKPAKRA